MRTSSVRHLNVPDKYICEVLFASSQVITANHMAASIFPLTEECGVIKHAELEKNTC